MRLASGQILIYATQMQSFHPRTIYATHKSFQAVSKDLMVIGQTRFEAFKIKELTLF